VSLQERYPKAKITTANFFGVESSGVWQLRGLGTIALTDSELIFERRFVRKEWHIPLTSIEAVETADSHLGKRIFQPLLKVVFRNEQGLRDSIAWYVNDLEGLKATIEASL